MHIIFEEHQYELTAVKDVLRGISELQDIDQKVSVGYVGYYYEPNLGDCVFILPKVLLNESDQLVIAENVAIDPAEIITPKGQDKYLTPEYRKFIYEFAVWIYRTISVYHQKNADSRAIYYRQLPQAGAGQRHRANTYLDIILSLIRFNQENQDFILYTTRNIHSGYNKINWTRTISQSQAILQHGKPIYLNPVNKKKEANFDEELFIIFYSILDYINHTYGFSTPINLQYELLPKGVFEKYRQGMGKTRLKQIRYKYFSDKAVLLWELCYAFFDSQYQLAVNVENREYLLAKKYNIIFEAMIDELIGTPHKDIPKGLADQEDGKMVDHMYTDLAVSSPESQHQREVYYIGDSKYYKIGHDLGKESIAKQYTYARNVIQWNINLWSTGEPKADSGFGGIRLRQDNITEGYDIIPNFFLSAFVDESRRYNRGVENGEDKNIVARTGDKAIQISTHFPDRLFDRDTLLLSHYDVNFLYIVWLYARDNASEKTAWRKKVRRLFRTQIQNVLQDRFCFYVMKPYYIDDAEGYIQQNYHKLIGKIFQPEEYAENHFFSLALEKVKPGNATEPTANGQSLLQELERYFSIEPCTDNQIDLIPVEKINEKATSFQKEQAANYCPPQWLTEHHLERYTGNSVVVGYYKSAEHWAWITGNNNRGTLIYNVRAHRARNKEDEVRQGSHTEHFYNSLNAKFIILYTDEYEKTGEYHVFHVKDHAYLKKEDVVETKYPTKVEGQADSDYYLFRFDEEVSIGKIDLPLLIKDLAREAADSKDGYVIEQPLFIGCDRLIDYRR